MEEKEVSDKLEEGYNKYCDAQLAKIVSRLKTAQAEIGLAQERVLAINGELDAFDVNSNELRQDFFRARPEQCKPTKSMDYWHYND
jgi:hypothetical protein